MKRILMAVIAWVVMGCGVILKADDSWDGGAGDGLWSSDDNWVDNTAPAAGGGGTITFYSPGLGTTNVVDQDWTISTLRYTNVTAGLAHTTIVAEARTLVIAGGDLRAGYQLSHSDATIRGGTVQIGDAGAAASLLVGVKTTGSTTYTGTDVAILSALNLSNLNVLAVAKNSTIGGMAATLDLSGSTLSSGTALNTLKAAELTVGGGIVGYNANGILRVPASLAEIEVGLFDVGSGVLGVNKGIATLDFGAASQLRRLTVTNTFNLGKNGAVTLIGWPSGVTVTVGRAEAPVAMTVGSTEGATGCGATLALTNGSLTAYLSLLRVGSSDGATGATIGNLDLSGASVQIGDEANKVKVGELSVGGGAGRNPGGTLRLPPAITDISVGVLRMGGGNAGQGGSGTLDFGAGSQLRSLTVSNGFYLGTDGQVTLLNWPTNVDVVVGSDGAPAPLILGCTDSMKNINVVFSMTNGSFNANLSVLQVGCSTTNSTALNTKGYLDLRHSTLGAFNVAGNVLIGSWPAYDNTATEGSVYLPAGLVTCASNLYVGDTAANSKGWLELNGTEFRVGQRLEIGVTGRVTNNVGGASSGIDFRNTDTNDFVFAPGGRLAVVFTEGPRVTGSLYWGLKMKGDVRDFMSALTNDPARFTLNTAGLPVELQAQVGVYYKPVGDFTYLGLPPAQSGTVLLIR